MSDALLVASGVSKSYRSGWQPWRSRHVLHDLSLVVRRGEIIGLTGENGSGKSTLVRILAGWARPDAGVIERRARMGYCPQDLSLFDELTVDETFQYFGVGFGLSRHQIAAATTEYLEKLNFARYRDDPVVELSEGTKQKLSVSLALMSNPAVILLDEPFNGFDFQTFCSLWDVVVDSASAGRAFLIVTHLVHDHSRFHRVLRLAEGRCLPVS